jgi:alpha-amylase
MNKVARDCYLPTNELLLKLINTYGCKFKVSFSITGIAIDQFNLYAPEVLESFKKLADTGCVEFLAETYSHSLVALKDEEEFAKQVKLHAQKIKELIGYQPKVFRNTELIYSDYIGAKVFDMGYQAMVTEGAKHILGWKSPNYLYCNAINPKLKILLRNYNLSDDIAFRFSNKNWNEYPLDVKKYVNWFSNDVEKGETINLFMDYETFGEHQKADSGIFHFLEALPKEVLKHKQFEFATPSEISETLQPVSAIHVPHPISWADEERDLTAWLGNDLQEDAFNRLYSVIDKIKKCNDPILLADWKYLQSSDHFYYMCTKVFSDGEIHSYFNPFESPYDAYTNYMNILSDFIIRLNASVPESRQDKELATLAAIIFEKTKKLEKYEEELKQIKEKQSRRGNSASKNKPHKQKTKELTPIAEKKKPTRKKTKTTTTKTKSA